MVDNGTYLHLWNQPERIDRKGRRRILPLHPRSSWRSYLRSLPTEVVPFLQYAPSEDAPLSVVFSRTPQADGKPSITDSFTFDPRTRTPESRRDMYDSFQAKPHSSWLHPRAMDAFFLMFDEELGVIMPPNFFEAAKHSGFLLGYIPELTVRTRDIISGAKSAYNCNEESKK